MIIDSWKIKHNMKEMFGRKVNKHDLIITPSDYGFASHSYSDDLPYVEFSPLRFKNEFILVNDIIKPFFPSRDVEGKRLEVGDMVVIGYWHTYRIDIIAQIPERQYNQYWVYCVGGMTIDSFACYKIIPEIIGNEQYTLMQLGMQ